MCNRPTSFLSHVECPGALPLHHRNIFRILPSRHFGESRSLGNYTDSNIDKTSRGVEVMMTQDSPTGFPTVKKTLWTRSPGTKINEKKFNSYWGLNDRSLFPND